MHTFLTHSRSIPLRPGVCRPFEEDRTHVVVLATHDLNAVARYASKVVLIHQGEIVSTGSRDEVLSQQSLEQVFRVRADAVSGVDGQPVYVFHRL